MKRSQLAIMALAIGLAACQEVVTAPGSSSVDLAVRAAGISRSNPPPPPIDTGASISVSLEVATTRMTDPFTLRSSILSTGVVDKESARAAVHVYSTVVIPLVFPVTYNRDEHSNAGYVEFHPDPHQSITTDPNSKVVQDPHGHHFTGTGRVLIPTADGQLAIHLGTVVDNGTVFEGCGPNLIQVLHPELCFGIKIGTVTLNDQPIGSATITPACYPKIENHFCYVQPAQH